MTGYVDSIPDNIVIDGIFNDWEGITGYFDDVGEPSLNGNRNIDISEFRSVESDVSISFYVRVDGTIMKGARILREPLTDIEDQITPMDNEDSIDHLNLPQIIPPKYGYDYAYVMMDIDKDTSTGYYLKDQIGADYMVRLVGLNGEILSKELYKYKNDKDPSEPIIPMTGTEIDGITSENDLSTSWEIINIIEAANDIERLELQVPYNLIDMKKNDMINYYILMTDWSKNLDMINDPQLGDPGEPGQISIAKMEDDTNYLDLTLPDTSQDSAYPNVWGTRATWKPGDFSVISVYIISKILVIIR